MDEDAFDPARSRQRSDGGREPDGEAYHTTHDIHGPIAVSTTIVRMLADISGKDVTELGYSLYEYVDADSLDGLFEPRHGVGQPMDGHLTFTVPSYRITVHGSGDIVIQHLDDSTD